MAINFILMPKIGSEREYPEVAAQCFGEIGEAGFDFKGSLDSYAVKHLIAFAMWLEKCQVQKQGLEALDAMYTQQAVMEFLVDIGYNPSEAAEILAKATVSIAVETALHRAVKKEFSYD